MQGMKVRRHHSGKNRNISEGREHLRIICLESKRPGVYQCAQLPGKKESCPRDENSEEDNKWDVDEQTEETHKTTPSSPCIGN
jgi:hypothetical protein